MAVSTRALQMMSRHLNSLMSPATSAFGYQLSHSRNTCLAGQLPLSSAGPFQRRLAGFQAFKAWMEDIAEKHGKTAIIPGMEPTGHYCFALGKFLQDNGMKPVHVNPYYVKKSKELDDNNPNKNDRKDPKTIAVLVNIE